MSSETFARAESLEEKAMRNKTEPTVTVTAPVHEPLLPGAVTWAFDYFSAVCAVAKAVMIATAIAAPIKLYSMAAVPDLSRRNAINRAFMTRLRGVSGSLPSRVDEGVNIAVRSRADRVST